VAVLCRDVHKHVMAKGEWLPEDLQITDSLDTFLAAGCDVVVEAAGQPAVSEYGERVLQSGAHFLVTSTGALADEQVQKRLEAAARSGGAGRLLLASGAMAGLDWMQAASCSEGGQSEVKVVQRKPPESWVTAGPVGEEKVLSIGEPGSDAWRAHGPLTVFEGSARQAATTFPKSSNVTATLALATAGLDATRVTLVADPRPDGCFSTTVELVAKCGKIKIEIEHQPSKENPRTSSDVGWSVVKSLKGVCCPVFVGA